MLNTHEFEDFLRGEGYRPSTVRKAAADLRTWARYEGNLDYDDMTIPRIRDYWWAYDAYDEFVREEGAPELPWKPPPNHKDVAAQRGTQGSRGRISRRNKKSKREIQGFTLKQFRGLLGAVSELEHKADPTLHIMMLTGMRIGDVLRVTPRAIQRAFSREDGLIQTELKGGKSHLATVNACPEAWAVLAESARKSPNVAASVSKSGNPSADAGGSAYQCVRKRLQSLCLDLGVGGPHNLHRIRRTVAVLLRKSGASVGQTQEVLGHASERTTAIYTSEYMPEIASAALHQMREFVDAK